jgi:sigma-E factor negative regulatory protein RseC
MGGLIDSPEQVRGQVRAIADGQARVAVANAGCASCGHASGCGIGKLGAQSANGHKESLVDVPSAGLRVGQWVTLTLDQGQLTRAALLGYLLPAILLLTGAVIGEVVGAGEPAAALGALLGLCCGLLLTRLRAPLIPRLTQEIHHV